MVEQVGDFAGIIFGRLLRRLFLARLLLFFFLQQIGDPVRLELRLLLLRLFGGLFGHLGIGLGLRLFGLRLCLRGVGLDLRLGGGLGRGLLDLFLNVDLVGERFWLVMVRRVLLAQR